MSTRSTRSSTDSSPPRNPIVVYKVGGSLLALPDLAFRIRQVLAQRAGSSPLLISGGGATADIVRQWDRVHKLGPERSHWMALESLKLNESLLVALLPEAVLVENQQQALRAWQNADLPIAAACEFVRSAEREAHRLPHCWEVTSDSIAAWLAIDFQATELVLLKSIALPPSTTIEAAQEFVDPWFPQLASQISRIGWVNLRTDDPQIRDWMP